MNLFEINESIQTVSCRLPIHHVKMVWSVKVATKPQKWFQRGSSHCSAVLLDQCYCLRSAPLTIKAHWPPFIIFIKAGADRHLSTCITQYMHTLEHELKYLYILYTQNLSYIAN